MEEPKQEVEDMPLDGETRKSSGDKAEDGISRRVTLEGPWTRQVKKKPERGETWAQNLGRRTITRKICPNKGDFWVV